MSELNEALSRIATALNKLVEDNKDDEDNEDKKAACPHLASLEKDYQDFLTWVTGESSPGSRYTRQEARENWIKNHPHLKMPRYYELDTPANGPADAIMLLMFDAYPMYLAEKK